MTAVVTILDAKSVQGNTVRLNFAAVDEDGNPYPLSGCDIYWSAVDQQTKSQVVSKSIVSDVEDGISITNLSGGLFRVTLESEDTAELIGDYAHEPVIKKGTDVISVRNTDDTPGILTFAEKITTIPT